MDFYNDLAIAENSIYDISNLTVNKLRLHYGELIPLIPLIGKHDGVVPIEDRNVILDSVNSSDEDKTVYVGSPFSVNHVAIRNREEVKNKIMEELKWT